MREDIAKWLEALRSGEYQQGKYALEMDGKFCCLGVYCKVSEVDYQPVGFDEGLPSNSQDDINIPVYKKLRQIIDITVLETGIEMNDEGKSFAEIADMIEEHYKNV